MTAEAQPQSGSQPVAENTDRMALIIISIIGVILAVGVAACLPGAGFIIRAYTAASASMAPTLPAGSYAIVSKASYGYSRYSFDWVKLPISGRFPSIMPQRGDLVVFKLPRDGVTDYMKRVVGLPGDTVQMVKGRLVINGQTVPREEIAKVKAEDIYGKRVDVPTYRESLRDGETHTIIEVQGDGGFFDNTQLFTVPQGHYFVLGDNRDFSMDSRVSPEQQGVGFVPAENLVGRIIAHF